MIPGLPQVGAVELIILLSIVLLFFGAKRIPELARSLGKGTREFRKGASEEADALREQGELPEEERDAHSEGVRAEQKASSSSGQVMLGVGPQELVIVGVLLLLMVVFGSGKFSQAARDVDHFLGGAKRTVEEVKSELLPEEVEEAPRAIKDFRTEALYGAEQDKLRRKP